MKHIIKPKETLLASLLMFVVILSGCATGTASTTPVDLGNTNVVENLCGSHAAKVLSVVQAAADSPANSGKRKELTADWGVEDTSDESLKTLAASVSERADISCDDVNQSGADAQSGDDTQSGSDNAAQSGDKTASGTKDDGKVGVEDADSTIAVNLPLYNGDGDGVVTIDSTDDGNVAPLLDYNQRYTANTLTWAGLVDRVGSQQWYIDGINANAAKTGFGWNDVLKFAQANRIGDDGKVEGVNALAIQVFNISGDEMSDAQVRDQVAQYVTSEIQKSVGIDVDQLPIQRINNGFINTRNIGSTTSPEMGTYFDNEKMIRVSLMPLIFDESGNATALDGSRGAGIFIDCGNLHWVPKSVWTCADTSCKKPVKRPTYVPPSYQPSNPGKPSNPGTPTTPPSGNNPKDWSKLPSKPSGVTKLGPGELTSPNESSNQKKSGQTSGNVTDNKPPSGTTSGSTTPDYTSPSKAPVAPGANQGGSDRTDDTTDPGVTNQDSGGTGGDTCIADPDTGVSSCN